MRYAIVIGKAAGNYSAFVPGLRGCVATGSARDEVEREMRAAIESHLDGMREDGEAIPFPSSTLEYIEMAA